jgi:alpha-galactosidase
MNQLGFFQTESSGHASEYSPYFWKRPDLVQKYDRNGYSVESGYSANNWPEWRAAGDQKIRSYLSGADSYPLECSEEYASTIGEAVETHKPAVIYGNVLNTQLIENLTENGVVELACLVDKHGIQPTHFGSLPTQLAALNHQHMAFHELAATAMLEQNREAAIHVLMVDPLTAAVCSLEEIRQLFDEMVAVQQPYLPEFLYT